VLKVKTDNVTDTKTANVERALGRANLVVIAWCDRTRCVAWALHSETDQNSQYFLFS